MTNYVSTLVYLVPNAKIRYKGNDNLYNEIAWLDERNQPTQEECDAAWPNAEYEIAFAHTQSQRLSRYEVEIGLSFFESVTVDTDLTNLVATVDAIKTELAYPIAPTDSEGK